MSGVAWRWVSGEKVWQVASGAVAQLTVVIQQAVAQATSSNGSPSARHLTEAPWRLHLRP